MGKSYYEDKIHLIDDSVKCWNRARNSEVNSGYPVIVVPDAAAPLSPDRFVGLDELLRSRKAGCPSEDLSSRDGHLVWRG
jgi:hypothetical protein